VAAAVERLLVAARQAASLLDGDNLRHGLNADLGFSEEDRTENVRQVGEVARLLAEAGVVALVPVISPFRAGGTRPGTPTSGTGSRSSRCSSTPRSRRARRATRRASTPGPRGELTGMTGIDSPYEPPPRPELVLRPGDGPPEVQAERVLARWSAAAVARA
jgi:bifunctional enzyme CysN/CysC